MGGLFLEDPLHDPHQRKPDDEFAGINLTYFKGGARRSWCIARNQRGRKPRRTPCESSSRKPRAGRWHAGAVQARGTPLRNTIHDREVRLDNGWVVKIGRGFDIYQKPDTWFSVGANDLQYRRCLETTVDVFREPA